MPGGGMPGGACFALGRRALAGVAGLQRPPCARRLRDAWRRGGLEALASEPGVGAPCTWQTILHSGNYGWLIDVRAAMLGAGGGFRAKHPGLEPSLKAQLRAALLPGEGTGSGALPGELLAVPIGPDTSVGVLQRAVEAEQVHPVASTSELLPRLTDPFRCFALEHTAMPGRPLTFLYSRLLPFPGDFGNSLVRIMPNPCPPEPPLRCASAARSVVFYSVSAAEPGLRGIGLAGLLIKRAAGTLSMSHGPGLQSFATLSPVHGFRDWLAKHCRTLPSRIRVLVGVPSGFSRGATGEEVGEDELEQYLAALEEHRSSVLGEHPPFTALAPRGRQKAFPVGHSESVHAEGVHVQAAKHACEPREIEEVRGTPGRLGGEDSSRSLKRLGPSGMGGSLGHSREAQRIEDRWRVLAARDGSGQA